MPLQLKDDSQVLDSDHSAASVVSIDPGVRTFATGYDPSGHAFEWGRQDIGRVLRLFRNYDTFQSRWSAKEDSAFVNNHNKRRNFKRAGLRIQRKIRNIVDECHKKLVRFLVTSYRVVLLPECKSSERVVKKGRRRIGSKTARSMLT